MNIQGQRGKQTKHFERDQVGIPEDVPFLVRYICCFVSCCVFSWKHCVMSFVQCMLPLKTFIYSLNHNGQPLHSWALHWLHIYIYTAQKIKSKLWLHGPMAAWVFVFIVSICVCLTFVSYSLIVADKEDYIYHKCRTHRFQDVHVDLASSMFDVVFTSVFLGYPSYCFPKVVFCSESSNLCQ